MIVFKFVVIFICSYFRNHTELSAENLALRQQLVVLHRQLKRPKLKSQDRILWVWLSKL